MLSVPCDVDASRPGDEDITVEDRVEEPSAQINRSLRVWVENASGAGASRIQLEQHVLQLDCREGQRRYRCRCVADSALGYPHAKALRIHSLEQDIEIVIDARAHRSALFGRIGSGRLPADR